jgi:hypothetical protein
VKVAFELVFDAGHRASDDVGSSFYQLDLELGLRSVDAAIVFGFRNLDAIFRTAYDGQFIQRS